MHFEFKRSKMISELRKLGIANEYVLQAMNKIPRHRFVAKGMEFQAYDEKALPIGFGQTISHPYTVAKMTESLEIQNGQKILEIGTGSGYQTAVLCEMGANVFTVEIIKNLARKTDKLLRELKYNYLLRIGDGKLGWNTYAPFDSIIVTAGTPVTPTNLIDQLKTGGKLLIPLGTLDEQVLTMYFNNKNELQKIEMDKFKFVQLTGKKNNQV